MKIEVVPLLISLIPSLFLTLLALYYFKVHNDNEERRRRFLLHKNKQKQALPIRLQAYERMALFLERVSPGKLLQRMAPISDDKKSYETLLIQTIDQEFEHNMTQQIYISDDAWSAVKTAKNNTMAMIRKASIDDSVKNATEMREAILKDLIDKGAPSDKALSILKTEVTEFIN